MPAVNGRVVITRALQLIGAVGGGQTPSDTDLNDGLLTLNDMMDGWNADHLVARGVRRYELELDTAEVADWGLGPALDLVVTPNPVRIERFGIIINGRERQLQVFDPREWSKITNKAYVAQPRGVNVIPYAGLSGWLLTFWPVPDSTYTITAYVPQIITEFATLDTSYYFPAGWARAIRYNLAIDLAPEHELPLVTDVVEPAKTYLADIRRNNIVPETIEVDAPTFTLGSGGMSGSYDIWTDE